MATSENPKRSELFRFSGAGQLAEAIKREWPKLPVILATGFAELPADVPSLARMAKPFTQEDVAAALERVHPKPGKARVAKFTAPSPKT